MSSSPDLQRTVQSHGSSKRPHSRGTASYPRKRAVTACQVCRARRTKCDNLKPTCSFCLKTGATCIQSPVDLSSFDPASLQILERLDVVENLVRSIPTHSGAVPYLGGTTQSAEDVSPAPFASPVQPSSVLPERLENVLAWPIFGGPDSAPHVDTRNWDGQSSNHNSLVQAHTPAALNALLEDAPQTVNSLVEKFFSYVHVKNPVLDEAAARRLISSTTINGVDWSLGSCLYLLICALGSIATPFGASETTMPGTAAYTNAQAFFHAAERRLGSSIGSDDMVAAQCLFLSGVYMMGIFQPKKAWKFFIQAVVACQGFPFLRQLGAPSSDQDEDPQNRIGSRDYALQEAVYWSSWKSEREVRGELRLPDFSLADEDRGFYPSFFPTPPLQQETLYQVPGSNAKHEATAWYFYLAEISLRRLSSRICAEILQLARAHLPGNFLASTALAVPTWETEAQQWVDSLPAPLSFSAPAHEDDVCRFVLRGHLINLYELIYWPFVCAILGLGASATALEHELGSDRPAFVLQLAEKGLRTHMQRIEVNEPGFRHRHHGTWPMIRTCARSALILVASAMIMQDQPDLNARSPPPYAWREGVVRVLDLLTHWELEAPELRRPRSVLETALNRAGGETASNRVHWQPQQSNA